jgi:hypothetical protein
MFVFCLCFVCDLFVFCFCFWVCSAPCNPAVVNVFLLLRLERKLASKSFTTPHSRPDPDAAPVKTPLEIAEEKREALKFLAGYGLMFQWHARISFIESLLDTLVGATLPRGSLRRYKH